MDEKKVKAGQGVPVLSNKNSDFHIWLSKLQFKLDAKSLWDDFCARTKLYQRTITHAWDEHHEEHLGMRFWLLPKQGKFSSEVYCVRPAKQIFL
ncbi:TPA: hypothetical protein N0F65_004869 [Lagenidium giganteum]|uniref:Uncharacterized protein n=1 Tax=Lagenidium giganteum TaxID=4803 RepID=A0AAV2Z7I3_9STRA|nr:TPA: hypothetical protein N0F65_004869 [Lagenidium giganteum]